MGEKINSGRALDLFQDQQDIILHGAAVAFRFQRFILLKNASAMKRRRENNKAKSAAMLLAL